MLWQNKIPWAVRLSSAGLKMPIHTHFFRHSTFDEYQGSEGPWFNSNLEAQSAQNAGGALGRARYQAPVDLVYGSN